MTGSGFFAARCGSQQNLEPRVKRTASSRLRLCRRRRASASYFVLTVCSTNKCPIDTVNQGIWCLSIKLRLECFVIVA